MIFCDNLFFFLVMLYLISTNIALDGRIMVSNTFKKSGSRPCLIPGISRNLETEENNEEFQSG
jgi:hypothetical protein